MFKINLINRMKFKWFFLLLFLLTFSFNQSSAQEEFDTKGTDFWLAYLPNYHNNYNDPVPSVRKGDSLYIFIVAEKPTIGVIEYTNRDGKTFSNNFQINDPKVIYTFKVSYWDFEVFGYNLSGNLVSSSNPKNQSEKVGKNSFHIMTDNEVTVYAHSQAVTTSDAFLVLPTDVLGTEYLILTYKSDRDTPSQFLIVASEDNTRVEINPSKPTRNNGTSNK